MNVFSTLPTTCGYCGQPAKLVHSAQVYGKDYGGMMWRCDPCDAHVGCHKGTSVPLGSLADADLRAARQRAHAAFDPIWRNKPGSAFHARRNLYNRMARHLGLPVERTHIGFFDAKTCAEVVKFCQEIRKRVSE